MSLAIEQLRMAVDQLKEDRDDWIEVSRDWRKRAQIAEAEVFILKGKLAEARRKGYRDE